MAQNISLWGNSYSAVPALTVPKVGGGSATFYDVQGSETYTQNGTFDVTTLAQIIINVAGGGGSGLTYESGNYTTSSNIARPTISFTGTHSDPPIFFMMADVTGSSNTSTNTNMLCTYVDSELFGGSGYPYSSSAYRYGVASYVYRANSTSSLTATSTMIQYGHDNTGSSSSSYARYWCTNTGIIPGSASTSRYWRSGRTYKWIAVWKP